MTVQGEVVQCQNAGGVTTVNLPSGYCDQVYGLCGAYAPSTGFANTFAVRDASYSAFDVSSSVQRWGGPLGGDFQSQWADSWKVSASDSEALFTEDECPTGPSYDGDPPELFEDCPELQAQAAAACPSGALYEQCMADVGMMCDLDRWVEEAKLAEDVEASTLSPVKAPTETPTSTDAPTTAPTKHPCDDGSHGCDMTSTVCEAADKGYECQCLEGFVTDPTSTKRCIATNAPTNTPTLSPTAPTPAPFASCEELAQSGEPMQCYNFGDPHFTTFSRQKHNAMGQGEYILMEARNTSFRVHVCHQPGDKPSVFI